MLRRLKAKNVKALFWSFVKNHLRKVLNYFNYFGWIGLLLILSYALIYYFLQNVFPYYLLITIVTFVIIWPMKIVYILVGARNSLRSFFLLLIFTQVLFSFLYYNEVSYIDSNKIVVGDDADIKVEINDEQYVPIKHLLKDSVKTATIEKATYRFILLNTFYIALIQECSPAFEKYIEDEDLLNRDRFFIILNIQIFISWIYLGVLIASLYNKIAKR